MSADKEPSATCAIALEREGDTVPAQKAPLKPPFGDPKGTTVPLSPFALCLTFLVDTAANIDMGLVQDKEIMAIRVGINGFGRIGRLVFRAICDQKLLGKEIEVVAINDLVPADNLAYLLKYDSTQGAFCGKVEHKDSDTLVVNGHPIACLAVREGPKALPWKALGVDVVIESTGLFTHSDHASGHLDAGAKRVIISAPAQGNVKTVVMGVNEHTLTAADTLISNASCTTNCLAPMAKVVMDHFGIEEGLMTTVHSYTATQKSVDGASPKDLRGGRAAALNIIPASTGAAKAVGLVLPQLQGRLTGMSLRIPTPTVSVVDLTVRTERATSYGAICEAMKIASESSLCGILAYTEEEVVSTDFIHNSASCIFDVKAGMALNDRFFKLIAWYDNEWGYSCRCVDLLRYVMRVKDQGALAPLGSPTNSDLLKCCAF